MEVTKCLKPPDSGHEFGDGASVQADPTVESGKADTGGARLSEEYPICCTGVVAAACTQGKRTQHGKPRRVIRKINRTTVRDRPGALGWRKGS
jgi:hypothetical protein